MIKFLLKKLERRKIKRTFREYGFEIKEFILPEEGLVRYAQWLNPLEGLKTISQGNVNFFKMFIKKGDFAIDIGAHSGDTTIPMALAAGKEGLILALDPNMIVYKILEQNTKLNGGKTNIIPLCAAATKEDGEFFFHSSEATFNNGGISDSKKSPHGKFSLGSRIHGVNIERYINSKLKNYVNKLSFIKIDTEGHDLAIIQSIPELLSKNRPVIIAECFKKTKKQQRFELFDHLSKNSYDIYHVNDFTENAVFTKLNKNEMMNRKHFDLCAIPSEKEVSEIS